MSSDKTVKGLFAAAAVVALVGCGGGGGGGGPAPTPNPPAPSPARDTYARPAWWVTGVAVVDPAAPARLVVVEPANTVADSEIVYEADIDAAGNATNIAARYVLYVKQGRLFRYDLRDRGAPTQVSSATDMCEIAQIDGVLDIERVGMVLYTAGPNGLCNFGTVDDGRVFATGRMDASTAVRPIGATFAYPVHVQSDRVGWLVYEGATVGGVGGNMFRYMPSADFSATAVPVGFAPGTVADIFEASSGVYFSDAITYRFFNPATRTIVDAPGVAGQVIGRDAFFVYLYGANILRISLGGTGPTVPTVVGTVPAGYYDIGIAGGSLWFSRNSAPRQVLRMPTNGGAAIPVGTFVAPTQGAVPIYSVLELGQRVLAIDASTGETITTAEPGLPAATNCCFVDAPTRSKSIGGASAADLALFQRAVANGTELFSLVPPSNTQTLLGIVPPPPAGFFTQGIITREVESARLFERNFGSLSTVSRVIFQTGGAFQVQVFSMQPAVTNSLVLTTP